MRLLYKFLQILSLPASSVRVLCTFYVRQLFGSIIKDDLSTEMFFLILIILSVVFQESGGKVLHGAQTCFRSCFTLCCF